MCWDKDSRYKEKFHLKAIFNTRRWSFMSIELREILCRDNGDWLMSTYNVVLNCLKPEKKLLLGIRNIFWRKTKRGGFFHIKWLTRVLKIIYWKKNTQREAQPIKCSHFKVMMPLCVSLIYRLCYHTVNKKELWNQLNWLSYICFSLD